ncbi:hypothetical protein CBR_g4863 [Chara braunii]|uniref:Cytochrome P450 n=1 Tax=Chara braunii TaxID=69332 RepID=A0A388KIZ8_CHABU|nr:hypothetical protein CBR_g4863 [Chara braunii]|eukprot:GBG70035.1 hypothetical protein CBR_g4863 [Chara braunii]
MWAACEQVRGTMDQLRAELVSHLTRVGAHLGADDGSNPIGIIVFTAAVGLLFIFLLRLYEMLRRGAGSGVHPPSSLSSSSSTHSPSSLPAGDGQQLRRLASMPGPPKPWHSITGHTMEMLFGEKPQPFVLMDWARRYGDMYKIYQGRFPVVVISSLALLKEVFISRFPDFHDRMRGVARTEETTKGLFFARGRCWTDHRVLVMRYFSSQRLKSFLPIMKHATSVLLRKLSAVPEGEVVNLEKWLHSHALDVVGEAAFGVLFGTQQADISKHTPLLMAIIKDMEYLLEQDACAFLTLLTDNTRLVFAADKFLSWIPGTIAYKRACNLQVIVGECKKIVESRRKRGGFEEKAVDEIDNNLLSFMMRMRSNSQSSGKKLSSLLDDDMIAIAREMLVAGTDTTAETLSFVIIVLEKHPHVKAKLLAEIDGWFKRQAQARIEEDAAAAAAATLPASANDDCGNSNNNNNEQSRCSTPTTASVGNDDSSPGMQLTYGDILSNFPYLDQVIHETMRLYTIGGFFSRETMHDAKLGGYAIPQGTTVFCNIYGVHRNPDVYPDPETFRPERFDTSLSSTKSSSTAEISRPLRSNEDRCPFSQSDPKGSFFGFGMGPRRCPGQGVALLEMKVLLIHLLHHFEFGVVGNEPSIPQVDIEAAFVVKPKNGLLATVRRRHV